MHQRRKLRFVTGLAAQQMVQDAAVIAEADGRCDAIKFAIAREECAILQPVDHMTVAKEAALEQRLSMVAADDQDCVLPGSVSFELGNQLAQRGVCMRNRVPICPLDGLRIASIDRATLDWRMGKSLGNARMVIGEMR